MQITVSGKQVELSEALKVRVNTALTTITGKYFDHAQEAHITFSRARSFFTCDINIHAARGLGAAGARRQPVCFSRSAAALVNGLVRGWCPITAVKCVSNNSWLR